MMPQYLELTEDQMVERLSAIQKLARNVLATGHAEPYNIKDHERTCVAMLHEMNKLAEEGDVV